MLGSKIGAPTQVCVLLSRCCRSTRMKEIKAFGERVVQMSNYRAQDESGRKKQYTETGVNFLMWSVNELQPARKAMF